MAITSSSPAKPADLQESAPELTPVNMRHLPKPCFANFWSHTPQWATQERYRGDVFAFIVAYHILALALAPFTFTWAGFALFLTMYFLTGAMGIGFCYHRMLTHKAFEAVKPLKYLSCVFAALSLEGGPMWWVATHRLHHRESDQEFDTHFPVQQGFMWSHMGWLLYDHPEFEKEGMAREEVIARYVPDLTQDPGVRWIEKYNVHICMAFLLIVFAVGYAIDGWFLGLSLAVWGGILRNVWGWHVTWTVNSVTHIWGYRNYETRENSKNNALIALITNGEGWHNNHHADQRAARNGQRWFEFDVTYYLIKGFNLLGLTSKLVPFRQKLPRTGQVIDLR